MARKSGFVSGFDIAARVFKALANAVHDAGGDDEDVRRIESDAQLQKEVGKLFVGAKQAVGNIFQVVCEGSYAASGLIKRGRYDWSDSLITDKRFPLEAHPPITRQIELLELKYDPSSEDVLAELQRHGLQRPTAEDALYFGLQYKDEQRKNPIVFLHEPVLDPGGFRVVLVLGGDAGCRSLDLGWFGGGWDRGCRFAGLRES